MARHGWILAAAVGMGVVSGAVAARGDESADLEQLFADAWEFELREDPLAATQYGETRFNADLPRISLADSARRLEQERAFLARCEAIDGNMLSRRERINQAIF